MANKRIFTLVLVLALVILAAAGGWFAGTLIQSPAEAAARTAPPPASPILVPVEQRTLAANIVTRGTARYGLPQTIALAPSDLKPKTGVITTLPAQDTLFNEGDVILTASGRPVFVLSGDVPAYRDLAPTTSGRDVKQLEDALVRFGFDPGEADGIYDLQTGKAVAEWYDSAGWKPFGPTAEQLAKLTLLQEQLDTALVQQAAAEDAALAAPLTVEAARALAAIADKDAAAEILKLQLELSQIQADENAAEKEIDLAATHLERAEAHAAAVEIEGRAAIQNALNVRKAAEREAEAARKLVERLSAALEEARATIGVQLPLDEVVFIPALPVRVGKLDVEIGDLASGPVMQVTNNQLAVDGSLPLNDAPLVQVGMPVVIDEPELGIEAKGVVERVADGPGTNGVDNYHVYFETLVVESASELQGVSLRLTIRVQSTAGDVIAVPVNALSLAPDGSSRVQVDKNGSLEYVSVKPGFSTDGFVEVDPLNGSLEPGQLVVVGFEQPSTD